MNGEQLFYILLVAAGGALGAVLRYGMSFFLSQDGHMAWGTLAVNLIGSFLICLLFFKFADMSQVTKIFLFIGVFGAFTTMSSVSLETMNFFSQGNIGYAFLTFLLNTTGCVGAGYVGMIVARLI
ncbi:MAG: CrcB family protein [Methanomassiliicoccaceae archaeon]|jgi:CrcB protein|nr:CrcB family protein [Methanomassiliicoccaceae archaeon]